MLRGGGGRGWWYGACTESLGSDSGDVGGDGDIDQLPPPAAADDGVAGGAEEEARVVEVEPGQEEERRRRRGGLLLPPAMPRASDALVIRAERRGGRLILTQVRAAELERRGVFRASRDGGRLLLRFADDERGAGDVAAVPDDGAGGEPEANEERAGISCGADDDDDSKAAGEVVAAAQHGGGCVGGEFCQVAAGAAGPRRVEVVGAVVGI